jgi:hypothetical protein
MVSQRSLNLIAQAFGGSNNESLSKDSEIVAFCSSRSGSRTIYYKDQAIEICQRGYNLLGDQPIVAARTNIGIVVFLYGRTGFFIDDRKIKFVFSFRNYRFYYYLGVRIPV